MHQGFIFSGLFLPSFLRTPKTLLAFLAAVAFWADESRDPPRSLSWPAAASFELSTAWAQPRLSSLDALYIYTGAHPPLFTTLAQLCRALPGLPATSGCVTALPEGVQCLLQMEVYSCSPSFCRPSMKILNKTHSLRDAAAQSSSPWKVTMNSFAPYPVGSFQFIYASAPWQLLSFGSILLGILSGVCRKPEQNIYLIYR